MGLSGCGQRLSCCRLNKLRSSTYVTIGERFMVAQPQSSQQHGRSTHFIYSLNMHSSLSGHRSKRPGRKVTFADEVTTFPPDSISVPSANSTNDSMDIDVRATANTSNIPQSNFTSSTPLFPAVLEFSGSIPSLPPMPVSGPSNIGRFTATFEFNGVLPPIPSTTSHTSSCTASSTPPTGSPSPVLRHEVRSVGEQVSGEREDSSPSESSWDRIVADVGHPLLSAHRPTSGGSPLSKAREIKATENVLGRLDWALENGTSMCCITH